MNPIDDFARSLPKAELHIHIEGTLEPEMMFELSERHGHFLPYESVEATRAAYDFVDLQSFLDLYYLGAGVLQSRQDFYELMYAYLVKASADGVRHAEVFFDPQTHTERGVGFETFMGGFREAIDDASSHLGITADLIMCFLRHLGGEEALRTLAEAEDHLDGVIAVGLDSSEVGFPPELFVEAYDRARSLDLRAVAHAGEEGPPSYVWGALDDLGAERIDHGNRAFEDPVLVERLVKEQVPLTGTPLSNVALRVVDTIDDHPLRSMLDHGVLVSVNSDDPAYFHGYVGDNYVAVAGALGLGPAELAQLARNSVASSFIPESRKAALTLEIDDLLARHEG